MKVRRPGHHVVFDVVDELPNIYFIRTYKLYGVTPIAQAIIQPVLKSEYEPVGLDERGGYAATEQQ